MTLDDQGQSTLLGFLGLYGTPEDGFYEGILFTDLRGTPKEFRHTQQAVTFKPIQQILYGPTLQPYVAVDLCGLPLWQALDRKPSLVLVNKESLLGMKSATNCPVVLVSGPQNSVPAGCLTDVLRAEGTVDTADESTSLAISTRPGLERYKAAMDGIIPAPLAISTRPGLEQELAYAKETLIAALPELDPLEPFGRIDKAIQFLIQEAGQPQ